MSVEQVQNDLNQAANYVTPTFLSVDDELITDKNVGGTSSKRRKSSSQLRSSDIPVTAVLLTDKNVGGTSSKRRKSSSQVHNADIPVGRRRTNYRQECRRNKFKTV
jgi:hypothetical protein